MLYPKPSKEREPKYLEYIRTLKCSVFGCEGDSCPAHMDKNTNKGTGTKASDFYTDPLCHSHHMEEHRGQATFWHKVFAEDTWYLFQSRKASQTIRAMKWLVSEGRTDEALELLRRFS